MQLNKRGTLREGLAVATCLLLSVSMAHAEEGTSADASATPTTSVDSEALYYSESGSRVKAVEGVVAIKQVLDDGSGINLHLTVDSLSGGSPNGALPSHTAQTFATPSGRSLLPPTVSTTVQTCTTPSGNSYACGTSPTQSNLYTTPAGKLPQDNAYTDQREAISLGYDTALGSNTHISGGGGYSHEIDFQSLTANLALTQDLNQKNTTLALGANYEHDSISPIGGTPVALSDYALFERTGNKTKNVSGLTVGLTQILTRRWVTQLNLSLDKSSGYQNDPYKIVSELDSQGNPAGYIYEKRPDQRTKKILYWGNRFALDQDTINVSYRYEKDDWGVSSNTAELRYRYEFGDGQFLEPVYRWYKQSSASFYRMYLNQGQALPANVSADPRLGALTAQTFGIKYGYEIDHDAEVSLKLERYQQTNKVTMPVLPQLAGLDLIPRLTATVASINLKFKF